jgi:hypothetical protein
MKTWVKIVLGIVTFIALIITAIFYFTAGMVDSADAFFTAVKQKDMTTARTYLAEDFKTHTDEKALTEFLANSAILNFKESSWSNREVNNGRGELEGIITTETGGVVPIKLSFVKENDEWKIYAIQKPTAGLQTETPATSPPATSPLAVSSSSAATVPTPAEQITLVKQSMHDFLISVGEKDMTHFRSTISSLWQNQFTTEQLNQAFKSITDAQADWSVLDTVAPVLLPDVKIDENGVLLLKGLYSTQPNQVQFEQKYIYEGTAWKLIGFSVQAK